MSQRQISLSDDLRRLRDDGYDVAVVDGYLVLAHVPYVTGGRRVDYGALVSELTLRGDVTTRPSTHVAYFAGERPCDQYGSPLVKLINSEMHQRVGPDIVARFMFSSKPAGTGYYPDYYEKMTTYCAILSAQAQAIDPQATARTYRPVPADERREAFHYLDTASSRAGIGAIGERLAIPDLAIVGLGGTGSYILDLVAKTPVQRIHLFDGDHYLQHNAFRSPGAPTLDELRRMPTKVGYLADRYSAMHRGIVPHPYRLEASNVHELDPMLFVFLAIDEARAKKAIIDRLEASGTPFVDVGMGVYEVDGTLAGLVRTTTSTGSAAARAAARSRISFGAGGEENLYDRNIQIADLNALNAALAVIAWKKLMGYYNDLGRERFTAYAVDSNSLINEDEA